MHNNKCVTYYIPDRYKKYFKFEKITLNGVIKDVEAEHAVFTDSFFEEGMALFTRESARTLADLKIDGIISDLDRASRHFLDKSDPEREPYIKKISDLTGLSESSVERSVELEFLSSLASEMRAALTNEFGDYNALDSFTANANLKGRTRAIPQSPVFSVSSSNIPALPHLSIMRSFMTKNCVIIKTSKDEPIFTPLYMEYLKKSGSKLADCAIVICYAGGDHAVSEKLIERSKTIIVYGGIEACEFFKKKALWPKTLIMHSHKLGFGIIGADAAANEASAKKLAEAIVFDVATFEQQACLAPHAYFYSTQGNVAAERFLNAVVEAFERAEKDIPPAVLSPAESFKKRSFIDGRYFDAGVDEIRETSSKKSAIILGKPDKFPVSPLNRVLFLIPYSSNDEIMKLIIPITPYLQNVSLSVKGEDSEFWHETLSRMGVSRICPAGRMPAPSMMWRHDGICALSAMVKFCDSEVI